MTLQSSSIFINDIHLYAFHGVMEQERRVGAFFTVSLRVDYDMGKAIATDDIADAISYADVCQMVKEQMANASQLLEHVAGRMAEAILRRFPQAMAVHVTLTKDNPPMQADCRGAGVSIVMTRI